MPPFSTESSTSHGESKRWRRNCFGFPTSPPTTNGIGRKKWQCVSDAHGDSRVFFVSKTDTSFSDYSLFAGCWFKRQVVPLVSWPRRCVELCCLGLLTCIFRIISYHIISYHIISYHIVQKYPRPNEEATFLGNQSHVHRGTVTARAELTGKGRMEMNPGDFDVPCK